MLNQFRNLSKFSFGLVATLGVMNASPVFAGADSSGGGDAIVCHSFRVAFLPLPGNTNAWLADTFNSRNERGATFNPKMSEKDLDEAIFNGLNQVEAGLGKKVSQVLKTLRFVPKGTLADLPDDHIVLSGKARVYCKKHQLAIQYNKGTANAYVEVNQALLKRLTHFEQRLFRTHEALISLHPNYSDTTELRKKVKWAANGGAMMRSLLGKVGTSTTNLSESEFYTRAFALAVGSASQTNPQEFYTFITSEAAVPKYNGRKIPNASTAVQVALNAAYYEGWVAIPTAATQAEINFYGVLRVSGQYVLHLATLVPGCAKHIAGRGYWKLAMSSLSNGAPENHPNLPLPRYYSTAREYATALGKYICTQPL